MYIETSSVEKRKRFFFNQKITINMQSFRTELENPIVEQDIIDLEKKIRLFREGSINDEKFRSLRLARGIYGQRQPGVQMIRIKLPFGKVTFRQLLRIADVADEYGSGNLHLTTRQDIQMHYVSLDRTPELWEQLEKEDVTIREACGNTVRNVTSSPDAGINPDELFDVSPFQLLIKIQLLVISMTLVLFQGLMNKVNVVLK
jgi:sulfite reductase (ferredoxin)